MVKWPSATHLVPAASSAPQANQLSGLQWASTAKMPSGWVPGAGEYLNVSMTISIKIYNAGVGILKINVDEALMTILTKGNFPLFTILTPNGKIIRFEKPSVRNITIERDLDSVTVNMDLIIGGEDIKIEDPI